MNALVKEISPSFESVSSTSIGAERLGMSAKIRAFGTWRGLLIERNGTTLKTGGIVYYPVSDQDKLFIVARFGKLHLYDDTNKKTVLRDIEPGRDAHAVAVLTFPAWTLETVS